MPSDQLMRTHDVTFLQMPRECRPSTWVRWGSNAAQTKRDQRSTALGDMQLFRRPADQPIVDERREALIHLRK